MRIVLDQERRLRRLCTALFWLRRIGFRGTDDHSLVLVQPVVTTDTKHGCFFITKPTRSIQGTTDGILPKFWSRKWRYQLNYKASHSKSTTWLAAPVFFFYIFFLRMLAITNFNLADEDVLAQQEEDREMKSRVFHKTTCLMNSKDVWLHLPSQRQWQRHWQTITDKKQL